MKRRVKRDVVIQPSDGMTYLIPLTRSKVAVVDACDYSAISEFNWSAIKIGRNWYASRVVNKKAVLMHRVIAQSLPSEQTDHANGNGLDNRRLNLRPCTKSQNMANRIQQSNNTCGFKGVWFFPKINKWTAYVKFSKKRIHLGCFKTAENAAIAYNVAALKYFGEFARLNLAEPK